MSSEGNVQNPEWAEHPAYLADGGGLFGAPPRLKCRYCEATTYELYFGHCRTCATQKGVPQEGVSTEEWHRQFAEGNAVSKMMGGPIVARGVPKAWDEAVAEAERRSAEKEAQRAEVPPAAVAGERGATASPPEDFASPATAVEVHTENAATPRRSWLDRLLAIFGLSRTRP